MKNYFLLGASVLPQDENMYQTLPYQHPSYITWFSYSLVSQNLSPKNERTYFWSWMPQSFCPSDSRTRDFWNWKIFCRTYTDSSSLVMEGTRAYGGKMLRMLAFCEETTIFSRWGRHYRRRNFDSVGWKTDTIGFDGLLIDEPSDILWFVTHSVALFSEPMPLNIGERCA